MSAGTVVPPVPTTYAGSHGSLPRPSDPAHPAGEFSTAGENPQSEPQGTESLKANNGFGAFFLLPVVCF